jgi:8-oxo-dGTP pyrophosphatase MutT (NUDIX family)
MHLFINDKPVRIISSTLFQGRQERYQLMTAREDGKFRATDLSGKIAVVEPSEMLVKKMLETLRTKKLKHLQSLLLVTADPDKLKLFIKSQFKIVKAAGGIVSKGDKLLLMFRLGKWDFPKGKLEKGEKSRAAALREVEEECGIRVKLDEKLCSTWHTYTLNGSRILKKTKWFAMTCMEDSKMKPQKEEGIEQLLWVDRQQAETLLSTSYLSIQFIFQQFCLTHPQQVQEAEDLPT